MSTNAAHYSYAACDGSDSSHGSSSVCNYDTRGADKINSRVRFVYPADKPVLIYAAYGSLNYIVYSKYTIFLLEHTLCENMLECF